MRFKRREIVTQMWNVLKKLNSLLEFGDRKKVILVVMLMVVTAFVQTVGIASIMPFLAVLADPEMVTKNDALNFVFTRLGFNSVEAFLYFLGIAAFLIFTMGTALQAASLWVVTRFSQLQQYHLSRRLMADYLRRPYSFFLSRNSGDLAKTVLQETGIAVNGALLPAMQFVGHVLLAAAIVGLLVIAHPVLAVSVALAVGVSYTAVYLVSRAWLDRTGRDRILANRQRFTASAEAFAGAKEIRLLARENEYLERYREPSQRLAMHTANAKLLKNLPVFAMEAIAFGGVLLVVLALMAGEGGVATALPLIGLYGLAGKQLIPAVNRIFGTITELRFNMPSVDNVLDDLGDREGSRPLPDASATLNPLVPKHEIKLMDLTFRYAGADEPALRNVSLSIPARSTAGIVGASGAGKSTLIDLLLGLLDPEKGEIRIDDVVLTAEAIPQWQATLGYVPQHIFLADQSVAQNIALGVPEDEIDQEAVEHAARLANLHDFVVNELPMGYKTSIGERGVRLSGGQRQRIGIARALYRDPSVLIFDEATSALDNATEQSVMDAIHNLAGQKTIFLVAHRLTTVKDCDFICVFSAGELVEVGNWSDLVSHGQHFQRLSAGVL
ncbi:ABC transporter ATP-binding protein [Haliea sp. E1-2-M8]|uniref:ABC transporter ATP-binding protein n=1 Tax=Haliea sp. E1-2-M8 TaxID=3064706 RepID=UPI002715BF55|nr:ABC transporter ATP-binding protein [Haliea sp. E1-2-M8]MDO8860420.1 ABC transporter ATP-binding protein [Haliea sp. E1-2-M8]